MIFVSVGTQEFQFNRLLKAIDDQIVKHNINEEVFAQIGYSDYIPQNYRYTKMTKIDEFNHYISKARIIICHGGTGTIINSIRLNKKVIGFPRLKKYGEHVDDHQIELIQSFGRSGYIVGKNDVDEIEEALKEIESFMPSHYESGNHVIKQIIGDFIESL